MAKKAKVLLDRGFEVSRIKEQEIRRAEGDDTKCEQATLTDGSGDKIVITMSSLPTGITEGAKVQLQIINSQTKIEDHN